MTLEQWTAAFEPVREGRSRADGMPCAALEAKLREIREIPDEVLIQILYMLTDRCLADALSIRKQIGRRLWNALGWLDAQTLVRLANGDDSRLRAAEAVSAILSHPNARPPAG